jgi:cellulose synthase/poly-beta-1,6-N-acetylglucosamine synthase-like glycosyltransferase
MRLAVLIPAFNEQRVIGRTIASVLQAGIRKQDVYVVDDGSKDGTGGVAKAMHVHLLRTSNGGKATAIKRGFDAFEIALHYTHVMILDADSCLSAAYLPAMTRAIAANPDVVCFSSVQQSERPRRWNVLTAYRAMEYTVFGGLVREAQHLTSTITIVPGPGSIFRTVAFAALSFEDMTLIEDIEWTCQLHRKGLGKYIYYVPEATVLTQDPANLRDYCGQLTRWNRGIWQVIRRYRLGRQNARIDWEWRWMLLEQCVLAPIFLALIPFWFFVNPKAEWWMLGCDAALITVFAALTSIRQRRWDVLLLSPCYFFLRCLGWFLFVRAGILEQRRTERSWYTVQRYS